MGRVLVRSVVVEVVLVQISLGVFGLVSALWIFSNPENQRLTHKQTVNTIVCEVRPRGEIWSPVDAPLDS